MSEAQDATRTHQDANLTAAPAGVASVPTVDAAAVLASHVYDEAAPPSRNARVISMPICESCGDPWRGDAATGGCEAVLLVRRVIALTGLLREVCDGVIDVAYWRSRHNAVRQRRAVAELEDMVRAAMAALADGG